MAKEFGSECKHEICRNDVCVPFLNVYMFVFVFVFVLVCACLCALERELGA